MLGIFIPWKSANTTNQYFQEPVVKHLPLTGKVCVMYFSCLELSEDAELMGRTLLILIILHIFNEILPWARTCAIHFGDSNYYLKKRWISLAGVAQWIECWAENQRVTSLIPSQGMCLGCRPGS